MSTRPFPGSCLSVGPALLGLFKSCGHTQWRAMDAPFPCFVLLHLLDHLFLRRPPALAFSSCWLHLLPAPPPSGPQEGLCRTPHWPDTPLLPPSYSSQRSLVYRPLCSPTPPSPSCLSPPDVLLITPGKTGLFKFGAHVALKRILKTTDDAKTFLVGI